MISAWLRLPGTAGLSYVIKDAVAERQVAEQWPSLMHLATEAGSYLGRSSHLTDGYEPIRLLDAENKQAMHFCVHVCLQCDNRESPDVLGCAPFSQQVSMLITAAGFWRRTFFPLRWFARNLAECCTSEATCTKVDSCKVNTAVTRQPVTPARACSLRNSARSTK